MPSRSGSPAGRASSTRPWKRPTGRRSVRYGCVGPAYYVNWSPRPRHASTSVTISAASRSTRPGRGPRRSLPAQGAGGATPARPPLRTRGRRAVRRRRIHIRDASTSSREHETVPAYHSALPARRGAGALAARAATRPARSDREHGRTRCCSCGRLLHKPWVRPVGLGRLGHGSGLLDL